MADITMCLKGCDNSYKCYRWTAPASDYQSVSDFKPDESGKCENFYERGKDNDK